MYPPGAQQQHGQSPSRDPKRQLLKSMTRAVLFIGQKPKVSKWSNPAVKGQPPYDPQENFMAVLSRYSGTVLPLVLTKPLLYALILLHATFHLIDASCGGLLPLDTTVVVSLPATLLIFLVVFYNGNCYTRFFELWKHTCELNGLVTEWVMETCFFFDMLDELDGVRDGQAGDLLIVDASWRAVRRVLSAMYLLFMALDVETLDADKDWLGRTTRVANLLCGEGLEEEEYTALVELGLLTPDEAKSVTEYPGLKCNLPIRWALSELKAVCKMDPGIVASRRHNFENLQTIATAFSKKAILIVTFMQQPLPFVYFHVLKIMMVLISTIVSYSLVEIFGDEGWMRSTSIYILIQGNLLGLMEIAGAMADPFGKSAVQFMACLPVPTACCLLPAA